MTETQTDKIKRETKPESSRESTATEKAPRFSKEQALRSEKYRSRRDALGVLLKNGRTYSAAEIDSILNEFMKGKVK